MSRFVRPAILAGFRRRPGKSRFGGLYWPPVLLLLLVGWAAVSQAAERSADRFVLPSSNAVVRRAFDDFYNQEYDRSIRAFESLAKEHPEDPFLTNYLFSAVLFKELNRVGALDTESYADNEFLDRKAAKPLDPAVRTRLAELQRLAEGQVNRLLAKNPDDIDALYARGSTRALRCTYMGMGEKAWISGIRAAIGARRDHERVLDLNPDYVDAKLVVGVHNYVVGSMSWPVRVSASIVGIGGNRRKGLAMLREAADSGPVAGVDAKIALALFLRREQHYGEALTLVQGLAASYPRSFLIALEHAYLLSAAGHGPESIAVFRQILTNYKAKKYPAPEPAKAAWGLGVALRGQRRFQEAAEAFDMVGTFPAADRDLVTRATLAAGEMYDTVQNRELAVKRYETVLSANSSAPSADLARRHIREPFHYR